QPVAVGDVLPFHEILCDLVYFGPSSVLPIRRPRLRAVATGELPYAGRESSPVVDARLSHEPLYVFVYSLARLQVIAVNVFLIRGTRSCFHSLSSLLLFFSLVVDSKLAPLLVAKKRLNGLQVCQRRDLSAQEGHGLEHAGVDPALVIVFVVPVDFGRDAPVPALADQVCNPPRDVPDVGEELPALDEQPLDVA